MRISMLRVSAGVFAAVLIGVICWSPPPKAMSAVLQVAQATPTEAPSESPSDQNMNPNPNTNATPNTGTSPTNQGVPTYNGKPAGTNMLNDNPNGSGWLSKFARNPGPDTSGVKNGMMVRHHTVRHVRTTRPPKP